MAVLGFTVLDRADQTSPRPPKTSLGVGPQAQRSLGSDEFVCFLIWPVQEFRVAWLCWKKDLEVSVHKKNVYQVMVHKCSLDTNCQVSKDDWEILQKFANGWSKCWCSARFGAGLVSNEEQ